MTNLNLLPTAERVEFSVDSDVIKVLRFMEENVTCDKLCAVAAQVSQMAPILWGHFDATEIRPISFYHGLGLSSDNQLP